MERKWNKTVSDKVDFIIHRIIVGIAFWIVSSVVITYQQYIVKHIDNILLNLLLYLVPSLIFAWFILVSRKKNQWKPFGNNSDIIGIIIILTVLVLLVLTIGIVKVII